MTNPSPQQALRVVTDAYAHVDLDALPDPETTWWTSSIAETHPGKKFHASSWCDKLTRVKHKQTTTRAYSEIAGRVCGSCTGSADGFQMLGDATHRVRQIARDVHAIAELIDTGTPNDEVISALESLERSIRYWSPTKSATAEHTESFAAATAAYNALRSLAASNAGSEATDALERYAAVLLLCRAESGARPGVRELSGQPTSALDLTLLGGSGKLGAQTAYSMKDAYGEFVRAVENGATFTDAREAAAAKALPVRPPFRIEQLPKTIQVPTGATEVRMSDIIDVWRDQATALTEAVLDEWVILAESVQREHADLGTVLIELSSATRGGPDQTVTEKHIKRFAAAYPYRFNRTNNRFLTVPVVVAAWLERLAKHHRYQATLHPSGDNTRDVLDAVTRFRAADANMSLATALAAARGVSTTSAEAA